MHIPVLHKWLQAKGLRGTSYADSSFVQAGCYIDAYLEIKLCDFTTGILLDQGI